jgi:hypothetical protein
MLTEVSQGMVLVVKQPTTVRSPDVEARAVRRRPRAAAAPPATCRAVTDVSQGERAAWWSPARRREVIVSAPRRTGTVILTPTDGGAPRRTRSLRRFMPPSRGGRP